jgi:glucose-1-phosphate adenylyltransferase
VQLRRAIVDRRVQLDAGLLDGEPPFRVTEKGLTLITPEMLGQQVHQLR